VADPQPRFEGLFTLAGHTVQNPVLLFRVDSRRLAFSNSSGG